MSGKKFFKLLFFALLGGLIYYTFSTPATIQEFNTLKLSQPSENKFSEGFEEIDRVEDLFPPDFSRWHQLTLQNNEVRLLKNPTKSCFVVPSECFMAPGKSKIEISTEQRKRGQQSLKFTVPPTQLSFGRKTAAGIRRHLFDFDEGEDLYFSGWFYLEGEQKPFTKNLMFWGIRAENSSWRYRKEPGRFFFFDRNNYIASDLFYWLPKPEAYKQTVLDEVNLPFNQWVNLRFHIKFSTDNRKGLVEVWQDNKKILYFPGQTLPQEQTKYSILELGILNHEDPHNQQTLYIDDIRISDKPIFKL